MHKDACVFVAAKSVALHCRVTAILHNHAIETIARNDAVLAKQAATVEHKHPTLAAAAKGTLLDRCSTAVGNNQSAAGLALQRTSLQQELALKNFDTPRAAASAARGVASSLEHFDANHVNVDRLASDKRLPPSATQRNAITQTFECDWRFEHKLFHILAFLDFDRRSGFSGPYGCSDRSMRSAVPAPESDTHNATSGVLVLR
jgi:hypothetical protein